MLRVARSALMMREPVRSTSPGHEVVLSKLLELQLLAMQALAGVVHSAEARAQST
jgi:hypothetical protein